MNNKLIEKTANALGFHLLDTGVYDRAKDAERMAHELAEIAIPIIRAEMHDHINEMLAPIGLCLYRITPTESADDYGLADRDGDSIDIETVLKPAMDNYYKVEGGV